MTASGRSLPFDHFPSEISAKGNLRPQPVLREICLNVRSMRIVDADEKRVFGRNRLITDLDTLTAKVSNRTLRAVEVADTAPASPAIRP
jgi:hypothetical protein